MIELGQKAEDKITGFYGVITARVEYLVGGDEYRLTPPATRDNVLPESEWFIESRLKILAPGLTAADFKLPTATIENRG